MKLCVSSDPQDKSRFWVYNPLGGRGHWVDVWPSGRITIVGDWLGPKDAPPATQKALKQYLKQKQGYKASASTGIVDCSESQRHRNAY